MKWSYLIIILLAITFCSCEFENKKKYENKKNIGKISDPFGMATYQAYIYEDSTFYLPSEGTIVHWSEGLFLVNGDTMSFVTTRGKPTLKNKYIMYKDTVSTHSKYITYKLTPIKSEGTIIFLYWLK